MSNPFVAGYEAGAPRHVARLVTVCASAGSRQHGLARAKAEGKTLGSLSKTTPGQRQEMGFEVQRNGKPG